jgi:GNAT superfamily N-acetyltransferase
MSLFGEYIKEREGKRIIEDEYGFATYYTYNNNEFMYIEDLYVVPEKRKEGRASYYADEVASIARKKGIKKLLGSIDLEANGSTTNMKVLLAYGFELYSANGNIIYLKKEIGV